MLGTQCYNPPATLITLMQVFKEKFVIVGKGIVQMDLMSPFRAPISKTKLMQTAEEEPLQNAIPSSKLVQ